MKFIYSILLLVVIVSSTNAALDGVDSNPLATLNDLIQKFLSMVGSGTNPLDGNIDGIINQAGLEDIANTIVNLLKQFATLTDTLTAKSD